METEMINDKLSQGEGFYNYLVELYEKQLTQWIGNSCSCRKTKSLI